MTLKIVALRLVADGASYLDLAGDTDAVKAAAALFDSEVAILPAEASEATERAWSDGRPQSAEGRVMELEIQLNHLKTAIFGRQDWPGDLAIGAFMQMAKDTEAARKAALSRAERAEEKLGHARELIAHLEDEQERWGELREIADKLASLTPEQLAEGFATSGAEARWIADSDAGVYDAADECTCCDGTGITKQTERPCACQPAPEVARLRHRSFPEAADARAMPPGGDELMMAGLGGEDARFVAIQLMENGITLTDWRVKAVEELTLAHRSYMIGKGRDPEKYASQFSMAVAALAKLEASHG